MHLLLQDKVLGDAFAGSTNVSPLGLLALGVLGLLTIALPRRHALMPALVLACFIPSGQRVVIASLDFTFLRLMVTCGWIRVLAHGEYVGFRFHLADRVLLAGAAVGAVATVAREGELGALIQDLGGGFDEIGAYFLARILIRSWTDLDRAIETLGVLAMPVAASFVVERLTGRNLFSVFGGVPEITAIREGRLRCQGAFSHPILAGCFWASVLPLLGARWWGRSEDRVLVVAGALSALAIVVLTASSTPVAAVGLVLVGAAAWRVRHRMRRVRWGVVGTLAVLHFVMQKPVWHLISRFDLAGGSTGWHRYFLIDRAIANFSEWAAVGVTSTAHWGAHLFDITNQYVLVGIRGGVLDLALFCAAIALAFRAVGRTWRRARRSPRKAALAWAVGIALFVHAVSFLAVSYFGQIVFLWSATLGFAVSLEQLSAREVLRARREQRMLAARDEPSTVPAAGPRPAVAR